MHEALVMAAPRPIEDARRRTGDVKEELEVASAELGLVHEALERHLPQRARTGDVAWAIDQSAAVEQKLEDAVEELDTVTRLLEEEEAERQRLERQLAAREAQGPA